MFYLHINHGNNSSARKSSDLSSAHAFELQNFRNKSQKIYMDLEAMSHILDKESKLQ